MPGDETRVTSNAGSIPLFLTDSRSDSRTHAPLTPTIACPLELAYSILPSPAITNYGAAIFSRTASSAAAPADPVPTIASSLSRFFSGAARDANSRRCFSEAC